MASQQLQNLFDDDEDDDVMDVPSLFYDDPCQLNDLLVLGLQSTEPIVLAPTVTLTSLNSNESERDKFFDLDFEIEGNDSGNSLNYHYQATETLTGEKLNLMQDGLIRSPSPMSMTASMSGSEPQSPGGSSHPSEGDSGDDLLQYLLQDSGNIKVKDETSAVKIKITGPASVSDLSKLGRQSRSSSARGVSKQNGPWTNTKHRDPNKNAVTARENRLKKKLYIQSLEDMNKQLSEENSRLQKESGSAQKKIDSLHEEIKYLHKVLFNQSALAGLLKKLNQRDVRLSKSLQADESNGASSSSSGGVCLHVNGKDAILKMCARCARDDMP